MTEGRQPPKESNLALGVSADAPAAVGNHFSPRVLSPATLPAASDLSGNEVHADAAPAPEPEKSPRLVGPFVDGVNPVHFANFFLKALQEFFFWKLQEIPLVQQIASSKFYRDHGPRYYLNVTSAESINVSLRPVFDALVYESKNKDRLKLSKLLGDLAKLGADYEAAQAVALCNELQAFMGERCCASHPELTNILPKIKAWYSGDRDALGDFSFADVRKLAIRIKTQVDDPGKVQVDDSGNKVQVEQPRYLSRMSLPRSVLLDALQGEGWFELAGLLKAQPDAPLSSAGAKLAKIQATYNERVAILCGEEALPDGVVPTAGYLTKFFDAPSEYAFPPPLLDYLRQKCFKDKEKVEALLLCETPVNGCVATWDDLLAYFKRPTEYTLSPALLSHLKAKCVRDIDALPKMAQQLKKLQAIEAEEKKKPKVHAVDELLELIEKSLKLDDQAATVCQVSSGKLSSLEVLQRAFFCSDTERAALSKQRKRWLMPPGAVIDVKASMWDEMLVMLTKPANAAEMPSYRSKGMQETVPITMPSGDEIDDECTVNGQDARALYRALWRRFAPVKTGGSVHAREYDPLKADVEIALHHPLFRREPGGGATPRVVSVLKGHGRTYVEFVGDEQAPPAPIYIPGTTVAASRERKIDKDQVFTVFMVTCLGGRGVWDGELIDIETSELVEGMHFSLANHNWDLPKGTRISEVHTYEFPHPSEVESMALFFDWFDWLAKKKEDGMQQIHVKLHLPGLDYMVEAMHAYFSGKITKSACFQYLKGVHQRFANIKDRLKKDANAKGLGFSVGTPYDTIQRAFLNEHDELRSIEDIVAIFSHLMTQVDAQDGDTQDEKYCLALADLLREPQVLLDGLKRAEPFNHLKDLKAINPGSEKTEAWKRFNRQRGSSFKTLLDHGNVVAVLQSGVGPFSRSYKQRNQPVSVLYPASEIPQIHEAGRLAAEERKAQLGAAEAKVEEADKALKDAQRNVDSILAQLRDCTQIDVEPMLAPARKAREEAIAHRDKLLQQGKETIDGYATLYLSPLSTNTGVNTYQVDCREGVDRIQCEWLVAHCASTACSPMVDHKKISRYKDITDKIFGTVNEPTMHRSPFSGVGPSLSDPASSSGSPPDSPRRGAKALSDRSIASAAVGGLFAPSIKHRAGSPSESSFRPRASTWPPRPLSRSASVDNIQRLGRVSRTPGPSGSAGDPASEIGLGTSCPR